MKIGETNVMLKWIQKRLIGNFLTGLYSNAIVL